MQQQWWNATQSPRVLSMSIQKLCVRNILCTPCWVGEGPHWSCIPNLLCHFNKLLSQSHDHTSVLWGICCCEEERKRFHIVHGSLSLCHSELPVIRESRLGTAAGSPSLLCPVHEHCSPKVLVWLSHSLLFHLCCLPSSCFWGWCWWIGKGNTELKSNMRQ